MRNNLLNHTRRSYRGRLMQTTNPTTNHSDHGSKIRFSFLITEPQEMLMRAHPKVDHGSRTEYNEKQYIQEITQWRARKLSGENCKIKINIIWIDLRSWLRGIIYTYFERRTCILYYHTYYTSIKTSHGFRLDRPSLMTRGRLDGMIIYSPWWNQTSDSTSVHIGFDFIDDLHYTEKKRIKL